MLWARIIGMGAFSACCDYLTGGVGGGKHSPFLSLFPGI